LINKKLRGDSNMKLKKVCFSMFIISIFCSGILVPNQIVHIVIKGDTLWDIARKYYNNPWFWEKIYTANKEKIKDPHWIFPEQEFLIPEVFAEESNPQEKQKEISIQEEPTKIEERPVEEEIEQTKSEQKNFEEKQEKELIGILPLEHKFSGKIVGNKENKILISQDDLIYLDIGSNQAVKEGTRCYVLRKQGKIKSEKTKGYAGWKVIKIGIIEITGDIKPNGSTAKVIRSYEPILNGDYVQIIEK